MVLFRVTLVPSFFGSFSFPFLICIREWDVSVEFKWQIFIFFCCLCSGLRWLINMLMLLVVYIQIDSLYTNFSVNFVNLCNKKSIYVNDCKKLHLFTLCYKVINLHRIYYYNLVNDFIQWLVYFLAINRYFDWKG